MMKCALSITLIISTLSWAQQKRTPWKEMTYAADGFAVTVPYPSLPHPDAQIPHTNVYPVYFPGQSDIRMAIRVKHQVTECTNVLNELKTQITEQTADNSRIEASSIKELFIDGHDGVEYRWRVNSSTAAFERHYCGDHGRLYVFSALWPKDLEFPNLVQRVLSSFRLVKPESPK